MSWRTYAPAPLLQARAYLQQHTGLPAVSLGIVGSDGHHRAETSYHIGWSHLRATAYSRQHARDTSRRTDAASAAVADDVYAEGEGELIFQVRLVSGSSTTTIFGRSRAEYVRTLT